MSGKSLFFYAKNLFEMIPYDIKYITVVHGIKWRTILVSNMYNYFYLHFLIFLVAEKHVEINTDLSCNLKGNPPPSTTAI